MRLLFIMIKSSSNLSVSWRFERINIHTSVSCISLQNVAGPRDINAISENIPNIWHKSSTKHKEVRPDWNDKNDNANHTRPRPWKVLPMVTYF